MKLFRKKTKNGYTIIETLISVSLFLIVVTYGMTSLINANVVRQKSHDMRSIMDNLSFIVEDISRNLRTGNTYFCITSNTDFANVALPKSGSSCWGFAFESSNGSFSNPNDQWVYYVDNTGKMFKSTQGPYIPTNFVQLTPDEVYIDPVSSFAVLGAEAVPGDQQQPFVTIKLVGRITFRNVVTPFSIQTSVSQRLLDR